MRTKHLFVCIHIKIRVRLVLSNMLKPSSEFYWPFFIYGSRLSLWYCIVFSLQSCDHLLGKGWPLASLVCDVSLCFCHFPIVWFGSGVVLDCIDSWFLSNLYFHEVVIHITGLRDLTPSNMTWFFEHGTNLWRYGPISIWRQIFWYLSFESKFAHFKL